MGRTVTSKKKRHLRKSQQRRLNRIQARNRRFELEALDDVWNEAAAKCTGSSHVESGSPCQDSVCTGSTDNGISIIALADGAGSARFSHYGSSLVVNRIVELVPTHLGEALESRDGLESFKERLISQLQIDLLTLADEGIDFTEEERDKYHLPTKGEFEKVSCSVKDLSSTLLFVAVYGNQYVALHLGDGVIGMEIDRSGNKTMKTLSMPSNGEFANETHFLTSRNACFEAKAYKGRLDFIGRKTTGFILMSDGPEAALLSKRTAMLAPACHKLINANRLLEHGDMEQQLSATLQQVIATKTSDDCSVALMSRIPSKQRVSS